MITQEWGVGSAATALLTTICHDCLVQACDVLAQHWVAAAGHVSRCTPLTMDLMALPSSEPSACILASAKQTVTPRPA
eukprot:CAMPEP_0171069462 /NCGR_PEP_ID=MMETSP0766_2-20121228/9166_1 /TAXON_ID=439317 /ORGANISM="Gambierdiscus australes, Strain CAWD 149" /LENGTH=77 /DNA_ID=CAMNT_0011525851 /DNA_START=142 /DNA_END=371 /DNA_ORIENTATION=+